MEELMDEQQFQRNLASYQQEQEFMKHLTTLSTGSIVLIATFLEKLFANPEWKVLVGMALVSFILSIIGTLASHVLSILDVENAENQLSRSTGVAGVVAIVLSFGGFLIGIGSLAVFALKNLY